MNKPIVIALDFPSSREADALLDRLDPQECRVKIGKELFTRTGADWVRQTVGRGFDVFLDLKYHDIPNTVAAAVSAAADLGVWMVNVHAAGGEQMMSAAVKALEPMQDERPLLIGVTVLTSMNDADLQQIGVSRSAQKQVQHLASLAQQSGLDGVVCSASEAPVLREQLGTEFVLVTPGIRRPEDAVGDQKRVVGPAEAVAAGSTYLVVGRPITQAADPMLALAQFNSAVAGVA